MSTIVTLLGSGNVGTDRSTINTNFSNLNADKAETTAVALKADKATPIFTGNATFDTDTLFVDASNKTIGIGTVTPAGDGLVPGLVLGDGTGAKGITLFGSTTAQQNIAFTDTAGAQQGLIQYDHGGDYLRLFTGSSERMRLDSSGNVLPGTTETQDIGSVAKEWDNLFVQNSPTVSDERKKRNIETISYATTFMRELNPVQFIYKDTIIPEVPAVLDEEGDELEPAIPEKTITHSRPRTGFIAQEVKQAMTDAGLDDWAGYAYDEDVDIHSLRLNEFIGVLVQGWKEIDSRVTVLENA